MLDDFRYFQTAFFASFSDELLKCLIIYIAIYLLQEVPKFSEFISNCVASITRISSANDRIPNMQLCQFLTSTFVKKEGKVFERIDIASLIHLHSQTSSVFSELSFSVNSQNQEQGDAVAFLDWFSVALSLFSSVPIPPQWSVISKMQNRCLHIRSCSTVLKEELTSYVYHQAENTIMPNLTTTAVSDYHNCVELQERNAMMFMGIEPDTAKAILEARKPSLSHSDYVNTLKDVGALRLIQTLDSSHSFLSTTSLFSSADSECFILKIARYKELASSSGERRQSKSSAAVILPQRVVFADNSTYELRVIVVHRGEELNTGHYETFRISDTEINYYNDEQWACVAKKDTEEAPYDIVEFFLSGSVRPKITVHTDCVAALFIRVQTPLLFCTTVHSINSKSDSIIYADQFHCLNPATAMLESALLGNSRLSVSLQQVIDLQHTLCACGSMACFIRT